MEDEKINALVQWLNENGNEVSVDDVIDEGYNRYSVNREDYLVCTDEEADEEFRNSEEGLIDDLGIDSLDIVDLLSTISGEFDIEISEDDFDFSILKNVGDIVKYIEDYQLKKGY